MNDFSYFNLKRKAFSGFSLKAREGWASCAWFRTRLLCGPFWDDPRLFAMREMEESERPHMTPDDIALNFIEVVLQRGVMKAPSGMAEAMKTMAFMGFMPIIKIIVMEQSPSNQGTVIQIQMMVLAILIREHRHRNRMRIDAEIRMGHEGL
jgi:hypothetical protein